MGPRGGYELARERRRITVGEIVRIAMSLSTADPDDLGAHSVLLDRSHRARRQQGGRNLSRQSRFDHGRTDVRDVREVACARRREGQRRFRHLTLPFAIAREGRGEVALDRLRGSAPIHQAALQLRPLPAGIDPPAVAPGPRRAVELAPVCFWLSRVRSNRPCLFSIQKSTICPRRSKYKPHPGQVAIRRRSFARI